MSNPQSNYSDVQGPYSAAQTFTRNILPTPTGLVATYAVSNKQLTVNADAVKGASSYDLEVLDGSKSKISQQGYKLGTQIDASTLTLGTTYTVQLSATDSSTHTSSGAASVTLKPVELTTPAIKSVNNTSDNIVVTFETVAGANQYTVQVLDAKGTPLAPPVTGTGAASPISVDASHLQVNTSYQVQVRADVVTPPPSTVTSGQDAVPERALVEDGAM